VLKLEDWCENNMRLAVFLIIAITREILAIDLPTLGSSLLVDFFVLIVNNFNSRNVKNFVIRNF